MPRALLYLVLAVPLLTPSGFCLCHLGEPADVGDHDSPADEHRDHDPNCPCHYVDAGIRGFLPHNAAVIDDPSAVPAIAAPAASACDASTDRPDRENVPVFPAPPRYVVFLTLLI
jgi:hypothetical protein